MRIRRSSIVMLVALAPLGALSGQSPSPAPSVLPPLQTSLTTSSNTPQPSYAPAEAHGYRYTSAAAFGGADAGAVLTYLRNGDAARVFVTPYDSSRSLSTREDTMALIQGVVARLRDSLFQAALDHRGVYYTLEDRPDNLHVGNRTIRYYWFFAEAQRAGEQHGVYLYYAAYATPSGLVRVRGELPWLVSAHAIAAPASAVNRTAAGVVVIEGAGASSNLANRNSSRSITTAAATATSDASPFRDQLSSFGTEFVQYMVTHPPTSLSAPATAPVSVASAGAAPMNTVVAVCTTMPAATDTINYGVYATLEAPARKDPLPSGYTDLVLDALRHGLSVPNPLGLTAYVAMSSGGTPVMVPAVYGEVEFTLDNQGKMTDVHLTQSSLSPALDQAIYDAPRRADSLQAFPAEIGVINPGPIRFYVSISPVESHTARSMQLFGVRMPAWRPGARPGIDPARDVKPVFPAAARAAGVSDSVTIQFVVDEHGALIQRTMRLISAGHIEYAQSVMEAAIGSQYVPAMAAGCPVKGLIERTWQMSVSQ